MGQQQLTAGQKAAITRRLNNALRADGKLPGKNTSPRVGPKVKFRKLTDTSVFSQVHIDTPVKIYIHKDLGTIYVTPAESIIK